MDADNLVSLLFILLKNACFYPKAMVNCWEGDWEFFQMASCCIAWSLFEEGATDSPKGANVHS